MLLSIVHCVLPLCAPADLGMFSLTHSQGFNDMCALFLPI